MKLIDAVARDFPDSSKRTLLNWIKFGRILVEGKPVCKPQHLLEEGKTYTIKDKHKEIFGITILYKDEHIIVIDKPAGLLSVPAPNGAPSALQLLSKHYKTKNIFAVHRIDQGTSGVMIFVWGQEAQRRFDPIFAEHRLQREYIAIVEGNIPQDAGTWKSHLKELESYDVIVDPSGKEAITHYKVVKRSKNFSYLRLTLETGKKHQIRVHCKEAVCPILGDSRYGQPNTRLFLHAQKLKFKHPFTNKEMDFCSSAPPIFKKRGWTDEV